MFVVHASLNLSLFSFVVETSSNRCRQSLLEISSRCSIAFSQFIYLLLLRLPLLFLGMEARLEKII